MPDQSFTNLEKLMTVPEVAKYLRLSKSQLYLLIQKKKIPHVWITERRVVLRGSDVKKWISQNIVAVE